MSLSPRASLPLLPDYAYSRLSASSETLTWGSGLRPGQRRRGDPRGPVATAKARPAEVRVRAQRRLRRPCPGNPGSGQLVVHGRCPPQGSVSQDELSSATLSKCDRSMRNLSQGKAVMAGACYCCLHSQFPSDTQRRGIRNRDECVSVSRP